MLFVLYNLYVLDMTKNILIYVIYYLIIIQTLLSLIGIFLLKSSHDYRKDV